MRQRKKVQELLRPPGLRYVDVANIRRAKEWFEVLQTGDQSQTAMMTLAPGKSTGDKAEAHEESEQVLLVLEGALDGEIGERKTKLSRGDVIVIPAGVKHRFTNSGETAAVTFNVYSPPEYSPGTKG
jgi:mannose-6-phosphate isomerase-like protein (cupin superfamily)